MFAIIPHRLTFMETQEFPMPQTTDTGISQSTREAVVNKITDSLKALYPLAQSADEQLDILKKQNKGKFSVIFPKDTLFTAESDRFLPYMVEIANELTALLKVKNDVYVECLTRLMRKIHLMHDVLEKFHMIKDDEKAEAPAPDQPAPQSVL